MLQRLEERDAVRYRICVAADAEKLQTIYGGERVALTVKKPRSIDRAPRAVEQTAALKRVVSFLDLSSSRSASPTCTSLWIMAGR